MRIMNPSPLPAGRYFTALWPPAPVRDAIAALATDWLGGSTSSCRSLPPAHYHLTLHFLGDLPADAARRLQSCLDALQARQMPSFTLQLDRVGRFGRRVGWLGCRQVPAALRELQQGLAHGLREVTPPRADEPAFVPHVTLARGVRGDWPPDSDPVRPVAWDVREWVLARSLRAPEQTYRVVSRYPLGTS